MPDTPAFDHDAFARIVKDGLRKAEQHTTGLRGRSQVLLLSSIVSSGATTLVAGGAALAGPALGFSASGWQATCFVAAILAFVSTVTTTLNQQLKLDDRLSQSYQCLSRLRLLDVHLTVGGHSWEDVNKEYGDIAKTYPELFA